MCFIYECVYTIDILVVLLTFDNNWKWNMKYMLSFNGSLVVFVYQEPILRYMPKLWYIRFDILIQAIRIYICMYLIDKCV